MKHIKLFEEFIVEKSGDSYSSGCVMLYFNFPEMKQIHESIDQKDLYEEEGDRTFGLEDEPHVTLLYGLEKEVTPEQINEIVKNFKFGKLIMHNASLFENDYDVLKFDVKYPDGESKVLHECNEALRELPYNNQFPDYHPHMTIAYIKKGEGKKYTEAMKGEEYELNASHIVYSEADGTKTKIKLNETNESFIYEMNSDDPNFKKIMAYYDADGKEHREKVAISVMGKPNATRKQIIDTLIDSTEDEIIEYLDDLESQIEN